MPAATCLSRRSVLAMLPALAVLAPSPGRAEEILVVSRERVLQEVQAARKLRQIEADMTRRLQSQIDEAKARLVAEEMELTRLRAELSQDVFERRTQDFDLRVRRTRVLTQERATALQTGFQEARAKIVATLPTAEREVARALGARLILSADQVLFVDPALDVTDRVIAAFDRLMPDPEPPEVDLDSPILVEPAAGSGPEEAPRE